MRGAADGSMRGALGLAAVARRALEVARGVRPRGKQLRVGELVVVTIDPETVRSSHQGSEARRRDGGGDRFSLDPPMGRELRSAR
jgi:hypothetical protein